MKKYVVFTTLSVLLTIIGYAQEATDALFDDAVKKAQEEKYEEAIALFGKVVTQSPQNEYGWLYRGLCYSSIKQYEDAIPDYEKAIQLKPLNSKTWLNLGMAKQGITDYEGAIEAYNKALYINENSGGAHYSRGEVYELLGKTDSACADFEKAKSLGEKYADKKTSKCNDKERPKEYPIARLTKQATDDYGLTGDKPVKVGNGPNGQAANQRAYLDLLRDAKGKPITYSRVGSCCGYPSKESAFGMAMVDRYRITYLDADGNKQTTTIFISMYDYEEPMIIKGFSTVGKKQ